MSGRTISQEGAAADAGAWLARLQRDDLTAADAEAFEAWLAAHPDNVEAYREALAVWHEFETVAPAVRSELAELGRRQAQRQGMVRRRWIVGGGLAAAAALTVAVLPQVSGQPDVQVYATGKGEHRRIALPDGSAVDLNAESRLSVTYSGKGRDVVLADGEAIFDVAHDPKRPFVVEASGRTVRVLGTQFDVRNRDRVLSVTVARGKVQVSPGATPGAGAFVLTPGQRLRIDPVGVGRLASVDPAEAFGWRTGRLVYRNEPLADVVADLNRQFVRQIEISDPELARMPITGVIVIDDQDAVVARLGLMLPVRSVPSERGTLLLRK
ncbi:FecR domain-containing protein [Phenylobacterium sp.]|uniref:FecR family protein n=1 Tax=Phenylobacterium sp. TaxID=1871053 RepID=UPI00301CD307